MTGKNTFKNENVEINYYQFGNGNKKLIIIPGVSMDSIMNVAPMVEQQFALFSEDYTLYLVDRRNGIDSEISVKDMAEDVVCVMKAEGISDADIFGASQGGMIALAIAAYHPELVHMIYLASTLSKQNELSKETFTKWMELAKAEDVQALNQEINKRVYSAEYYEKYSEIFTALEKKGTKEQMNRFYYLAKACYDFDIYEDLNKIKCVVYLTASKKDNTLGDIGTTEIAEKLKCDCYIYEGYSHAVYDEDPDYVKNMYNNFMANK